MNKNVCGKKDMKIINEKSGCCKLFSKYIRIYFAINFINKLFLFIDQNRIYKSMKKHFYV